MPLSALLSPDTQLIPLLANGIYDSGQITGFGFDLVTQEIHGFLATPCRQKGTDQWCEEDEAGAYLQPDNKKDGMKLQLPESARKQLQDRLGRVSH